jgi:DNA-binding HxlR family transcriptional regulator
MLMAPTAAAECKEEQTRLLLDQLADKWTLRILLSVCPWDEPVRFNELKRRVRGVSQKTLTQCLRRLERNGLVSRTVVAAAPVRVEYQFTRLGQTLAEPFSALQGWADKFAPRVAAAQAAFDRQKAAPAAHAASRSAAAVRQRATPHPAARRPAVRGDRAAR